MLRLLLLALLACAAPAQMITFHDDGGWCWFEDERVIVVKGRLVLGVVSSAGNVEAVSYDPSTGKSTVSTLHKPADERDRRQWTDDHNSPAFLVTQDGRILAMYAKHGPEQKIYYRFSKQAGDATAWDAEQVAIPSEKSRVTYSNLHVLMQENASKGRIFDFFRGLDNSFKPSYMYSDDGGRSWTAGNVFIDVPTQFRHRPYVKYASNGKDTVHIAYTDGHPRDFDNSIYHIIYRNGVLHHSNGAPVRPLTEGLKAPEEGTRVFRGDANNVAWIADLHIDSQGNPYLAYSVQKDSAGLPPKQGGTDHRYRYARWDGKRWIDNEIAYAGTRIYAGEDDYTGLVALDPHDPNLLYISTNADPATGAPLISKADNQRHWEIYRGVSKNGVKWTWTAVTRDSTADNLRPVVPIWPGKQRALLWLEGKMRAYTDYNFKVVGLIENR